MEIILARGGRITWDGMLLISVLIGPLAIVIGYVMYRAIQSNHSGNSDEG